MRNTFFKREPVLTKTTQTRLLKTGLKQFGSIIFDILASNAGHEVRIWSETKLSELSSQRRNIAFVPRTCVKNVLLRPKQQAFVCFKSSRCFPVSSVTQQTPESEIMRSFGDSCSDTFLHQNVAKVRVIQNIVFLEPNQGSEVFGNGP